MNLAMFGSAKVWEIGRVLFVVFVRDCLTVDGKTGTHMYKLVIDLIYIV